MLNLKDIGRDDDGLRAVYGVVHTGGAYGTVLEHDLEVAIDPRTGAVKGRLVMEGLEGENLGEAVERLAAWCERMAIALREPMRTVASIPVFEKARGKPERLTAEGE